MPAIDLIARQLVGSALLDERSTLSLVERSATSLHTLVSRVNVPYNSSNAPPGLIQALTVDPWKKSGKYGLVWLYFGVILLVSTASLHFYHSVTDRIRTAIHEDEIRDSPTSSPSTEYEMSALKTGKSSQVFFPPRNDPIELEKPQKEVEYWSFHPINLLIALFRYFFYRPAPEITLRKGWRPIVLPAFSTLTVAFLGITMSLLYCFLPQPLFWQSIQYGSPPLAIRSGMMAVALVPWVVATAMKANIVSVVTGIGHQRLNVLHRWSAYLCLILSLVHTIPFYLQKSWDPTGYAIYETYFNTYGLYIFGTGEFFWEFRLEVL
jgi:Ferric reductase like transmembrane component